MTLDWDNYRGTSDSTSIRETSAVPGVLHIRRLPVFSRPIVQRPIDEHYWLVCRANNFFWRVHRSRKMHMYIRCIPSFFLFPLREEFLLFSKLFFFDFSFDPLFMDALCSCWNWTLHVLWCFLLLMGPLASFPVDISYSLWFCSVYISFSLHVQHCSGPCLHFRPDNISSFISRVSPSSYINVNVDIVS